MKTTAMKIKISNTRISNAIAKVMPDGSCELNLKVEMATQEQNNENANDDCILVEASKLSLKDECILVEASKLSLKDAFMKHEPQTEKEKKFKVTLTEIIKTGIEDFYRPAMDPSLEVFKRPYAENNHYFLNSSSEKIYYMPGEMPAIGKNYYWWERVVKDSKWCFGTQAQYVAFLGVLIKMLVAKGWTVGEAWDAVCNDSKKLGHYCNSENAKHMLEYTGSREICGFFDLANTIKILAKNEKTGFFCLAGGCYANHSNQSLACFAYGNCGRYNFNEAVAWLVLNR